MRIYPIASAICCILIISTGCAGQRTVEIATPSGKVPASKAATSLIDECALIAALGSDVGTSPLPGWKLALPINTYDSKTLFDYINGAAELYFAYDFRAVATAEYQNGETSIIVDVYDMTTSESAFGIYSLNRYPEASYVDIGNEGILAGAALDFWKGRYFCKVYSFDMSEKYQSYVVNFGNRLASKIQEAGEEPPVFAKLPLSGRRVKLWNPRVRGDQSKGGKRGRPPPLRGNRKNGLIPRTAKFFSRKLGLDNIRYVSEENVFNLNGETKGVIAEYQISGRRVKLWNPRVRGDQSKGGKRGRPPPLRGDRTDGTANFQLFVIEYPSPEEADLAFEAYSSHLDDKGESLPTEHAAHGRSKMVKVDGKFTFVKVEDQILSGFWDVETQEAAESILQNILANHNH